MSGKEEIVADRDVEIPGMEKEAVSEKDVAVESETNVEVVNPDNNQNDTSVMPDIRNVSDVNTARMDEDITDVTGKSEFMESEEKVSVDKAGWIVRRISSLVVMRILVILLRLIYSDLILLMLVEAYGCSRM